MPRSPRGCGLKKRLPKQKKGDTDCGRRDLEHFSRVCASGDWFHLTVFRTKKSRRWKHLTNIDSTGLEHSSLRSHRPASRPPYAALPARLRFKEASSEAEKRRYRLVSPFFWCGRRDLNPYSVNHTPLKRARLPVPPLPHIKHLYFVTRRRSPSGIYRGTPLKQCAQQAKLAIEVLRTIGLRSATSAY